MMPLLILLMQDTRSSMDSPLRKLRARLLLFFGLGLVVLAAMAVYGDVNRMGALLVNFPWFLMLVVPAMTATNHLLRFARWQLYLNDLGISGLSTGNSLLIFGSGLAMTVTPGKVGEWLKSYLLREFTGTAISRTAPVIVAERLTDALALVLLASSGGLLRLGWLALMPIVVATVLLLTVLWVEPVGASLLTALGRVKLLRSRLQQLRTAYDSARSLLRPRLLVTAVALATVSWSAECLGFWLILQGLGVPNSPSVLFTAIFIHTAAILGGALISPGGLGVTEGSITGLSQALLQLPRDVATTAAFLIRLGTLWFAVAVGLIAFFLVGRKHGTRPLLDIDEDTLRPLPQ